MIKRLLRELDGNSTFPKNRESAKSFHRAFLFLMGCAIGGAFLGALLGFLGLFQNKELVILFFSGIPSPALGFFSVFSSLLLNTLICLLLLFLFGTTAFGVFAVPAFLMIKGLTIGIGLFSFCAADGLQGWVRGALIYTPAATVLLILLLVYAVRAWAFSDSFTRTGFSSRGGSLDFFRYCKEFLLFISFAVLLSAMGSAPAVIWSVFFS